MSAHGAQVSRRPTVCCWPTAMFLRNFVEGQEQANEPRQEVWPWRGDALRLRLPACADGRAGSRSQAAARAGRLLAREIQGRDGRHRLDERAVMGITLERDLSQRLQVLEHAA